MLTHNFLTLVEKEKDYCEYFTMKPEVQRGGKK